VKSSCTVDMTVQLDFTSAHGHGWLA